MKKLLFISFISFFIFSGSLALAQSNSNLPSGPSTIASCISNGACEAKSETQCNSDYANCYWSTNTCLTAYGACASKSTQATCATVSKYCKWQSPAQAQAAPTGKNNSQIGPISLTNPLGTVTSPQEIIGKIINSVMGIVGSIALLMFIFGGLTWMTSAGKAEQIKKGRDIIVWSAIGLVIIFSAYGLVRLLVLTIKQ